MSDILAGFIVKNKAKTISFLRKRNIAVSKSDSVLDISDKLHDYAGESDANANEAINFITEGKSGFAWLTAIFGGEKSKSDLEASKNNTNAAIINSLTTKESDNYIMVAGVLFVIAVIVALYLLLRNK